MLNHESPLDAIRLAPDDDDLRLIYADWLEEQGDSEHAAYLRLALSVKRSEISPHSRFERLLMQRAKNVIGPKNIVQFERGFVSKLHYHAGDLPKILETLFRLGLVARLEVLRIDGRECTAAAIAVCNSPALAWVEQLFIACHQGQSKIPKEVGLALGGSPYLDQLHTLGLSAPDLGRDFMAQLLASTQLNGVRELQLAVGSATGRVLRDLATRSGWTGLRKLNLQRGSPPYRVSPEFALLARSSRLEQIQELEISGWRDMDTLVTLLTDSPHFQLTHLNLASDDLSSASALQLANSPQCRTLQQLTFHARRDPSDNHAAALALIRSTTLTALESLTLRLTDYLVAAITALPRPPALRVLRPLHPLTAHSHEYLRRWLKS